MNSGGSWGKCALVFSGTVGSCQSANWFLYNKPADTKLRVFQENDELQLHRLFQYLQRQGEHLRNLAILSEDETAYGGFSFHESSTSQSEEPRGQNQAEGFCDALAGIDASRYDLPVDLYYPRDISALRTAYQTQSIFSSGSSG
jgi:hypothetical protein